MLIRRVKKGDRITIGDSVIEVRKATEENLTLAIDAPEGTDIEHAADTADKSNLQSATCNSRV